MTETSHDSSRLTATHYWDSAWTEKDTHHTAGSADIERSYAGLVLHDELRRYVTLPRGARFLEVGCGGGRWMVYFATRFGYAVTGCDYSEAGCRLARQRLAVAGVAGTVTQADFTTLDGTYDIVFSAGFVEHFDELLPVFTKLASLLAPGGTLITLVPNLAGLSGLYHRLLKRETFETHRVVTLDHLRRCYQAVNITPVRLSPLGSVIPQRFPRDKLRRTHPYLYSLLWRSALGPATWTTRRLCLHAYRRLALRVESERFSPHLYAIGRSLTVTSR
jgi:SAM-dependent methyltransferase